MKVDFQALVHEFHELFKVPFLTKPQFPAEARLQLRIALLQEELDELKRAIADRDLVEVADALCDLQYVLSGTVLEFGMAEQYGKMFFEVHRSNMSKACQSIAEANQTAKRYQTEGRKVVVEPDQTGRWLVYDAETKKVLKSVSYSQPNLQQFLD